MDLLGLSPGEVLALEGDELLDLCREAAVVANRLAAVQTALFHQVRLQCEDVPPEESLSRKLGCRNAVELLQRVTGGSGRAIRERLDLGKAVMPSRSLTGEEIPPAQEHIRQGLESGLLPFESAVNVSKMLAKHTSLTGVEDRDAAERSLMQAATGLDFGISAPLQAPLHTDDIRALARRWDAALDPDGPAPNDEERLRRRFFNLGPVRDGMVHARGLLTVEVASALTAITNSLNNPHRHREQGGEGPGSTPGSSTLEGGDPLDDRTAAQKRHDALQTAVNIALASQELPTLGGAHATIVVEVKQEDLDGGVGWLTDHLGEPTALSASTVKRLSCGAKIQAVVRDSLGKITKLGSAARIFTAHQRRAIALRDGGCVIPGCTVPAAWCEVHHVVPHAVGGETHTDNGVLLCTFHHSTIDSGGWVVSMPHGIPKVEPPGWLRKLHPPKPLAAEIPAAA